MSAAGSGPSQAPLPQPSRRWLIVGLGNPGKEYEMTPHNLGFITIDRLAERHGVRVTRKEAQSLVGIGAIQGVPVILAKPQTYMNLSGGAVKSLLERNELGPGDLLVVYDELALPWGFVRVRPKGSSAGHKGAESLIRSLATSDFARVRVGVDPGHPRDGAEFVLAPMGRARQKELDELLDRVCQAVESVVTEGVEKAMAVFNRRAQGTAEEE